jgi:hypothetical protein
MTALVQQWSSSRRYRKLKTGDMAYHVEAQAFGIRDRAQSGQVKLLVT